MTPSAASHDAHASHDSLLIAALAADDLTAAARTEAEAVVASCPDCAALHADLVAIAVATAALPAPVRPRSFTLAPEQAAKLRPSAWQRFLGGIRAPGGFARPLAATFATLGIAGLLLTALPSGLSIGMLGGSSAALPAATAATSGSSGSSAETDRELASPAGDQYNLQTIGSPAPVAPGPKGSLASPAASGKGDFGVVAGAGSGAVASPKGSTEPRAPAAGQGSSDGAIAGPSPAAAGAGTGDGRTSSGSGSLESAPPPAADATATSGGDTGRPWLLVLSLALLGVGLGLFAARRAGRSD